MIRCYHQLLTKLYESELQYEKLKKTTAENHPLVSFLLSDQINKIKPSILENINNQKKNLEASKQNLYSTNGQYSSQLQTIPQKERDLVEISREQNIKSGIYNYFLQKKEETALSNISVVADSRVIDKAESFGPVNMDKKKIYLVAVVLAIGLGIGIISLNELINRTDFISPRNRVSHGQPDHRGNCSREIKNSLGDWRRIRGLSSQSSSGS